MANGGAGYGVAGAAPVEFNGTGRAVGFEILNRINPHYSQIIYYKT